MPSETPGCFLPRRVLNFSELENILASECISLPAETEWVECLVTAGQNISGVLAGSWRHFQQTDEHLIVSMGHVSLVRVKVTSKSLQVHPLLRLSIEGSIQDRWLFDGKRE